MYRPNLSAAAVTKSRSTISFTSLNMPGTLNGPVTPPRVRELRLPTQLNEAVLKDTPPKARSVDQSNYRTGTLEERRSAVIDDLGRAIPEIDLQFFLENILPPLRDGFNPTDIVNSLGEGGDIINGYWKLFEKEPKNMHGTHEPLAFGLLASLFDTIVQAANKKSYTHSQTLTLCMERNLTPYSEKGSTNRPDGCMVLKDAESTRLSWYDLGLTMEVKKLDQRGSRDDNIGKQIFNMQYLMSLDPCRRSTFGITIENYNMRLWFCSRSVVLVSRGFNFRTAHETLVRVFLSFAFASKTELGWDPTVSVTIENDARRFNFTVKDQIFKSVRVLSDIGADAIIGRATRAFIVKWKDDKLAVLKDVWIDDDRDPEHAIRSSILTDVEKKFVADFVKVNNQIDHTIKVLMRGSAPSLENTFDLLLVKPVFSAARSSTGYSQTSDPIAYEVMHGSRKRLHHRVHYRIVFREIGVPLHQVRKLSEMFTVLGDVSQVLEYIHRSGWVHRDISAGNVYSYINGRGWLRGLLGDLEYARRAGTDAKHEVRTGTKAFMAIEVESQAYRFAPIKEGTDIRMAQKYGNSMEPVRELEEYSDAKEGFVDPIEGLERPYVGESFHGGSEDLSETEKAEDPYRNLDSAEGLDDIIEGHEDTMKGPSDQSIGQDDAEDGPETASEGASFNDKGVDTVEELTKTMHITEPSSKQSSLSEPGRLIYNHLHDMESVWWAAIWMLFLHEDSLAKSRRPEADTINQIEAANVLFHQLVWFGRLNFFTTDFFFQKWSQCLPQSFKNIIEHPDSLRDLLLTRYTRAEATLPNINKRAFSGVHGVFMQAFKAARDESYGVGIKRISRTLDADLIQISVRQETTYSCQPNARKRFQWAF
ncbi:hypothetical protein M0805_004646 [Coniferiporia weirii]|nr:hypothetical protein M0805_004646 [Coniferiporia weirii]